MLVCPPLSYPLRQTNCMKLNLLARMKPDDGELITRFGDVLAPD
jgi:hypothetical protein